jgi:hypothetical protein
MGTPPTEFEFSPLSISFLKTPVTERPAEKDCSMREQPAGIQAKNADEPRKSSNAGPYVDRYTSNRVRIFSTVNITPVTLVTEKLDKKDGMIHEQQAGIQAKTAAEPRKSRYLGRYVDGDTSNRVRVFSTVDITPGDTCHRKAGQRGPLDA